MTALQLYVDPPETAEPDEAPIVQARELLLRIESNRAPLLIDTRSEIEFRRGHVKGAINIPVRMLMLHAAYLPPHQAREVVVTCEQGQRAAIANVLLSLYDCHSAEFLEGCADDWKEAGLPVQTHLFHLPPSASPANQQSARPRARSTEDGNRPRIVK
jgi:rhodanese-related sulfurtransferase